MMRVVAAVDIVRLMLIYRHGHVIYKLIAKIL